VERRNLLADATRRENTTEHSWHFALMALLLVEHAGAGDLDLPRALRMALVHDLAEIDAGDTYCHDERAAAGQAEREGAAAERIYGLLPADQGRELRELWQEFERGDTAESRYARAFDRLNPFLLNYACEGRAWKRHRVRRSQILRRTGEVESSMPALWPVVESLLDDAIARGWTEDAGSPRRDPGDVQLRA